MYKWRKICSKVLRSSSYYFFDIVGVRCCCYNCTSFWKFSLFGLCC